MTGEELAAKHGIDLGKEGKVGCPRCIRKGGDRSKNNLHVYGNTRSAYCHACGYTIASEEYRQRMGWAEPEEEEEEVSTRERITKEENEKLKTYTGIRCKGWRGIRDEFNKKFGIRYSYDEETGEPDRMYVPTTIGYELAGYKVRVFPKDFSHPVGIVGKDCELAGQFLFKNATERTVMIVGGEVDMVSAYQMLADYYTRQGKGYSPPAVVSPTVGETGCVKQIQAQYEFFSQFDKIVIGMDNDSAGLTAAEAIAKVLPKGKVYIAKWSKKDPNAMLTGGMEAAFINDYFRAKAYVPAGVVGSGDLADRVREEANAERISFPPFLGEINRMTGGGLGLGKICNIGAGSGLGKTVFVDSIIYHLIFHSPYRVGVVSMELNAGQYGLSMLSRHVGTKISNIADREERMAFLNSQEVLDAERNLYYREDGTHRWHLVDDRDGSIETLKAVIEQLIIACECKVIVLDPLQDILDGLTNEEQSVFLKWQKSMVKSHGVSFININHVRKSGGGQKQNSAGAMISEEDFAGSSTIFKSAALNILLVRDKMAEDEIVRNTTDVFISKNRDNGVTGPAGKCFYDNETHQLCALNDYLARVGLPMQ